MTSVNRVILTGRVVKTPRRTYRPDGLPVIQFPLEVDEPGDIFEPLPKGSLRSGRCQFDIVAIGRLAEFDLDRLQSGQALEVEGRLHQRCWRTPEGRDRTHVEIIATDLRIREQNKP